jgi:hypothetical protein
MYLAYIDDSRDANISCFCAIILPHEEWARLQDEVIDFRRTLKITYGIHVTAELHASPLLAGRGHLGAVLSEAQRVAVFNDAINFVASRQPLNVISACADRVYEDRIFERLIDRLNRYAAKNSSHILVISDNGKDYTSLIRKMRRYNFITSKFGAWAGGDPAKNRPITQVVEDLVMRDSKKSSFIQLADICAFSLLRSEAPTARMVRLGINTAFDRLGPVLVTQAFGKDPRKLGIIRGT